MLRLLRPKLARVALAAVLLTAQLVIALASTPPTRAVTFDPCLLSAENCATVTIRGSGNGDGTVDTTTTLDGVDDNLIHCSLAGHLTAGACSHRYFVGAGKSKTVYLYVNPASKNKICDQTACSSTFVTPAIVIWPGVNVTYEADFELDNPETLRVAVTGTGAATLLSSPARIDCGPICIGSFNFGTSITLYVKVDAGSVLRGWSVGPCHGQGNPCTFMIGEDLTIYAAVEKLTLPPPPTPIIPPTPKPTATPIPTPKSTPLPTKAPVPAPTPIPTAVPTAPTTSAPAPAPSPTPDPAVGAPTATDAPAPTDAAGVPGGPLSPTSDGTSSGPALAPIALAIVVVGLLIGAAIFLGLRPRRSTAKAAKAAIVLAIALGVPLASLSAPRAQAIVAIDPCLLAPDQCSTLTFTPWGNGTGAMQTATQAGVIDGLMNCRREGGFTLGDCTHRYFIGTTAKRIWFYATPASGSQVCSLIDCSTRGRLLAIDVQPGTAASAGANFRLDNPVRLTVVVAGVGAFVRSDPIGIDCGATCAADFNTGTAIALAVHLDALAHLDGWSTGPCAGQGPTCAFTITSDTTITVSTSSGLVVSSHPPHASPTPTAPPAPKPTPKATAIPTAAPTTSTSTAAPGSSPVPSAEPATDQPAPSDAPTSAATTMPVGGIGSKPGSSDSGLWLIVLAILAAGTVIAGALFAGLRRRNEPATA